MFLELKYQNAFQKRSTHECGSFFSISLQKVTFSAPFCVGDLPRQLRNVLAVKFNFPKNTWQQHRKSYNLANQFLAQHICQGLVSQLSFLRPLKLFLSWFYQLSVFSLLCKMFHQQPTSCIQRVCRFRPVVSVVVKQCC